MGIFGIAKRGLGILGKKMTGSHKIKKGSIQDLTRPKTQYDKKGKADWEFKADREELADIDRKLNIVKNVGKGAVGAVAGSYAYGKWKRHKRSKKKKDKK